MRRFASASLAVLAAVANAQDIKFDTEHNATTIIGSWASGSKNVTTGSVRHLSTPSRPNIASLLAGKMPEHTTQNGWAKLFPKKRLLTCVIL